MAKQPRVVAELGRPETPEEAAARKAAYSAAYRSSQNFRNLIAALIATLAVVLVIVFAVPRGSLPERDDIDVAAVAARIAGAENRPVVVPEVPAEWRVNLAEVAGSPVRAWTIVYVPGEDEGFVRVAQGFDADPAWATRQLGGADAGETVRLDGVEWTRYEIRDPAQAGNVTGALSTEAGSDVVLVYGTAPDETLEQTAAALAGEIRRLQEGAE